jgi:hypothetical protein
LKLLRNTIARFFLAVGIYVLLVLPWPGVGELYRDAYCAVGSTLFPRFGSEGIVRFEAIPGVKPGGHNDDTLAVLGRRKAVGAGKVKIPAWRVGYVPMAELAALVLATPIVWSRKWRALCWGLVLVNLFVVARLALLLYYWYYVYESPLRVRDPGPVLGKVVTFSYEFFFVSPACSFLIPAFVWLLVSLRREDYVRFLANVRSLKGEPRAA